jgi:hypothetical protein
VRIEITRSSATCSLPRSLPQRFRRLAVPAAVRLALVLLGAPSGTRHAGSGLLHRLRKCALALAAIGRSASSSWQRQYDVKRQRQVGKFAQAFGHRTLIGAAVANGTNGAKAAA